MVRWESLRNVRVDDLGKGELAAVRHEVEALRLDASRLHGLPFQVILGGLGIGSRLGLLGDRLDSLGAVDRLLGAGDIGQPTSKLLEVCVQRMVGVVSWMVWGAWSTHAACAHLNMVKEFGGIDKMGS